MTSLYLAAESGSYLVIDLLLAARAQLEMERDLNGSGLNKDANSPKFHDAK